MNELEQELKSLPLAAPSADLDQRIHSALSRAGWPRRRSREAMLLWWCLPSFAAVATLVVLLFVSPFQIRSASQATVYQFEAEGRMRSMLLNSAAPRNDLPRFVFHIAPP